MVVLSKQNLSLSERRRRQTPVDGVHIESVQSAVKGYNIDLHSGEDRDGSGEPHPQAGTRAYWGYVEESDAAIAQHPIRTTKVYVRRQIGIRGRLAAPKHTA